MESADWRVQLQRQRIVNKLLDTLKSHLPFSEYEKLQQLKKIAEVVEEEIYKVATCQSEYSRKICLHILTRLQNPMSDSLQTNSLYFSVPIDSTAQTGIPNGGDWQEEVYQKIKAMKELYVQDLRSTQGTTGLLVNHQHASSFQKNRYIAIQYNYFDMMRQQQQKMLIDPQIMVSRGTVGDPTAESGDWRVQLPPDSRQTIVNKIFDTLKRHLPVSEDEGPYELTKIAVRFEEKIYIAATSQIDYLRKISLKILTVETRSYDPMSDTI